MLNLEVQPFVVLPQKVCHHQVDLPQVEILVVDKKPVGPLGFGFLLLAGQDVDDSGEGPDQRQHKLEHGPAGRPGDVAGRPPPLFFHQGIGLP